MCVIITNSDIKQAALAALEEFFDEPCEQCHDVEELEAIMVAMVKTLNERLTLAEKKIKELEARPVLLSEPLLPYERQFLQDSPFGSWTITCNKI